MGSSGLDRLIVQLFGVPCARGAERFAVRASGPGMAKRTHHRVPGGVPATSTGAAIVPGHPQTKQWWRNLTEPARVADTWYKASGGKAAPLVLHRGDPGYDNAFALYHERWPRVRLADDALVVWVQFAPVTALPLEPRRAQPVPELAEELRRVASGGVPVHDVRTMPLTVPVLRGLKCCGSVRPGSVTQNRRDGVG